MEITSLVVAALLAGSKPRPKPTPVPLDKQILGSWECVAACPDEQIEFAVEGGQRTYASWLHDRPSVVGAVWTLEGTRLTVTRDGQPLYDWEVKATKVKLELTPADGTAPAVMRRMR